MNTGTHLESVHTAYLDTQQHSAGILDKLRQLRCGLTGHDELLQFSDGRLCLRCASCGHETPGWTIDGPAPVPCGVQSDMTPKGYTVDVQRAPEAHA